MALLLVLLYFRIQMLNHKIDVRWCQIHRFFCLLFPLLAIVELTRISHQPKVAIENVQTVVVGTIRQSIGACLIWIVFVSQ